MRLRSFRQIVRPDSAMAPEELGAADSTASKSVIQHQAERISQLEQVLDQTLLNVSELRSQLVHQDWLESQLAATEEIANVQQQVIHQLKLQIADRDARLEQLSPPPEDSSESTAALPASPIEPEPPKETPSTRLEVRFAQAQQQIQTLYQRLREDSVDRLTPAKGALPPERVSPSDRTQQQVAELQARLQDLEAENAKQLQVQALLHQACQELELEHEAQQLRILELEQQTAEMQEQILRQAQQASEYETAIQHWKDRFYLIQNQMLSIKELLEQLAEPLPESIVLLLATLPAPTASEQMQSLRRAVPNRRDLPEFLERRRGYRPS